MIFLLPHELKMLYADAQIHADQIKEEIVNYNQGTQVIVKTEPNTDFSLPTETTTTNPVELCEWCQ